MADSDLELRSSVTGLRWPALPDGVGATLLALQYQFNQSQWWPPESLRGQQARQLQTLLAHSLDTVPFYEQRLAQAGFAADRPLTPEIWASLPLLSREDIQGAGDRLLSAKLPKSHGRTSVTTTSGSTGKPVTVTGTEIGQLFWHAVTLRDHLWRGRDLSGKLAAIRAVAGGKAPYPKGLRQRQWSKVGTAPFVTGPAVALNLATSVEKQADWLQRENPDYLLTTPTNLLELAKHCREKGIKPSKLRDIATLGAVVHPELRALCREVFGVPLVDTYSAQEVGYLALQCPDHEHFHVQAESAFVEVLDDQGRACAPGEWGRVVVTPLHNLAMPLLRYDIGDRAEVGEPCACGRGLPVLARILGRARNILTLPSGERQSPGFMNDWFEGLPVRQFQIVQRALDHLEVKIVPLRPFTEAEEKQVEAVLLGHVGALFHITLSYHDEIPRSADGKYEDFRSEVDA